MVSTLSHQRPVHQTLVEIDRAQIEEREALTPQKEALGVLFTNNYELCCA